MSSCRILYVDDNRDACELAVVMFNYSDTNCQVTAAESAQEALRLIEEEPFDVYIFDYRMPGMSGVELCRYIRQFDPETPILFFSAAAGKSDMTNALAAGANCYLIKPDDVERLTDTVKSFLDENARPSEAERASIRAGVKYR